MVFGRRKINCDVDIKINSSQITRVNKTKCLGIMIDEQLNWKEQIHQVQTGLSRITGVMCRASHVLGTASLGETGASCYNFHSKSLFDKNMQARDFFGRYRVTQCLFYHRYDAFQLMPCNFRSYRKSPTSPRL